MNFKTPHTVVYGEKITELFTAQSNVVATQDLQLPVDLCGEQENVVVAYEKTELTPEQQIELWKVAAIKKYFIVPICLSENAMGPWGKPWTTSCIHCQTPTRLFASQDLENTTTTEVFRKVWQQALDQAFAPRQCWTPWGKIFRIHEGKGIWEILPKDPDCRVCNSCSWQTAGEYIGPETGLQEIVKNSNSHNYYSRLYHERSKIHKYQKGDDIQIYEFTQEMVDATLVCKKQYPEDYPRVALPDVTEQRTISIEETIQKRRSRRKIKPQNTISLIDLSCILFYGNGITKKLRSKQFNVELAGRAAPSGGGLYPTEIYFFANKVNDFPKGLYYYDTYEHNAVKISDIGIDYLAKHSGYPDMIKNAAVVVMFSSVFARNQWKYWERGYRVLTLDAGHLAENMHLIATARDIPSCCVMGFIDDVYNELLKIDNRKESMIYMMVVGGNQEPT